MVGAMVLGILHFSEMSLIVLRSTYLGEPDVTALQTSYAKMLATDPSVALTLRQAKQQIRSSCYSDIRSLEVSLLEGELILKGDVESYYLKQLAQTLLLKIPGITKITNHINVVYPQTRKGEI